MAKSKNKSANSFFVLALTALFFLTTTAESSENQNRLTSYDSIPVLAAGEQVIAGGIPFGVRLHTDGVLVLNVCDVWNGKENKRPASDAGVRRGDLVTTVNGEKIRDASHFCDLCGKSGGAGLKLGILRDGKPKTVIVRPEPNPDGDYKLGMWVKDSAAGIGTVTFIDPETGVFGGLGHGITEASTGELLPLAYGTSENVALTGIHAGRAGVPGELQGRFTGEKSGKLLKNTETGVYGLFSEIPSSVSGERFPIGKAEDVHEGKAVMITSVADGKRECYEILISELCTSAKQKNFTVTVTDERLLAETGGIVQGMSGSPIIQDGKLIGAVTHVLIGDPRSGYGIFIGNMLAELESFDSAAA
ncbi:MAG: SpoIVB peptidase [Ruminococcus sp.]|nr:SpoIVB peptidase [Candidatus Apopatosoma intestinale]